MKIISELFKILIGGFNKVVSKMVYFSPVFAIAIRVWLANIFWNLGLVKIVNWEATLKLFELEYKVSLISYSSAAFIVTAIELVAPVLLIAGFATRIGALAMLVMTLAIQLTYSQTTNNVYWIFLESYLVIYGAGLLSLDWVIRRQITLKSINKKKPQRRRSYSKNPKQDNNTTVRATRAKTKNYTRNKSA